MQERMRRVVLFMASATVPPHRAQIDFGAPVDDAYLRTRTANVIPLPRREREVPEEIDR